MIHIIYIYFIIGALIAGYMAGDSFSDYEMRPFFYFIFWLPTVAYKATKPIRQYIDYYTELSTWVSLLITKSYRKIEWDEKGVSELRDSINKGNRYKRWVGNLFLDTMITNKDK